MKENCLQKLSILSAPTVYLNSTREVLLDENFSFPILVQEKIKVMIKIKLSLGLIN
jgi:hypothetical protein